LVDHILKEGGGTWGDAIRARGEQADQEFILHDEENEGGWTDWICPKPDSYLMKCCDCGLVHEMQTRVANYESRPSEDFVVSSDPDLQAQFRVRRHEVLEATPPAQPAQQEPVGMVKDLFTNAAWCKLDVRGSTKVYLDIPPQRTWVDLTDEEIDNINYTSAHMLAREVLAQFKEKNT
jgi:hypothetical protein